jgi:4-hydroxy-tetrahydrodipicolinate synthase
LFVETSPAPVKYACAKLGFSTDEVRLPLVKASTHARQCVDEAMEAAGLLKAGAPGKLHAHG